MECTLLFVHGTGVRDSGYSTSVRVIEKQLRQYAPQLQLAHCCWGSQVGACLRQGGASVPTYGTTRGVALSDADLAIADWSLLLQDPAFELGMLDLREHEPSVRPPGAIDPAQRLLAKFSALRTAPTLKRTLAELDLDCYWPKASDTLTESDAFHRANLSAGAGETPHRKALARALVASLVRIALDDSAPIPDREQCDALTAYVAGELGYDKRGLLAVMTTPLRGLAMYLLTTQMRRKRKSLTDATYPEAGDVLLYQAKGDALRTFILRTIEALPDRKIFIFAHSLGSIASFEMLVQHLPSNVKGLITFGSQVPFLYEMGALATLAYCEPAWLPDKFPRWLNFYDLNDPLSYIGKTLFQDRMSDCKIESGLPFPASHSAYLQSKKLWLEIASFVNHD